AHRPGRAAGMARRPDRGAGRAGGGGRLLADRDRRLRDPPHARGSVRDVHEAGLVVPAQYRCGDARRRRMVRDASPPTINGIDYLEVGPDQKTLEVTFLHNLPGEANGVPASPALKIENVVVEGGVRITGIHVTQVASSGNVLTVTVDASGDFS